MAMRGLTYRNVSMSTNRGSSEKLIDRNIIAAQDYFDYSMSLADSRYDASYNYIWYNDNGPWSTRFTAWYIPGLLYRNQGDDVSKAEHALRNL